MKKNAALLILFLISLLPLFSENIVGTMRGQLILENGHETSQVELKLEDLASADYLFDNPFVQGVELVFSIPENTRNFRNSFALYLYRDIQPEPDTSISHYRGNQFFMQILPYTSEFSLKIPFDSSHTLRKEADSVVTAPIGKDDFPLVVTMLPISKGLPPQGKNASVTMTVRPLYSEKGGLRLIIDDAEGLLAEETAVMIDDSEVEWPQDYYSLDPGFHRVVINNPQGGTREFNIAVEQGKFTEVRHTMQRALPRVIFSPEEGVSYYLDGEEISREDQGRPLDCEPGRHRVSVRLNDQITLSEEYIFSPGENVTISLDLQILLEKD